MATEAKPKRARPARKLLSLELKPEERAKLERLVAARGERATMAGVLRELIAKAE